MISYASTTDETQEEDKEKVFLVVRHTLPEETQTGKPSLKRKLLKWFGGIFTLTLGAASFVPSLLRIPSSFQPWVFVTFTLWFFTYCTGFFNS